MKIQATAIICAYNEENTIINILKEISGLHLFNEVIVINDGSIDDTGKFIREFKKTNDTVIDVHLPKNEGKGFAMVKGTELASSDYLVFIDADLSNFTKKHVQSLLTPVLKGSADMVLGQATNTLIPSYINPFKNLSGQRALKKSDLIPILKKMETVGYGVETLINMHFRSKKKKVKYVNLKNLKHPTKFHKAKTHQALKEFIMEGYQIVITIFTNFKMSI